MTWLTSVIEFIKAAALFAWPVLIGLLSWVYRSEISNVLEALRAALGRVKEADVLGVKFQLQELKETTALAETQLLESEDRAEAIDPLPPTTESQVISEPSSSELVRREALRSPRSALILLAGFI